MSETDKMILRKVQKCPYDKCEDCEIVHCPARRDDISYAELDDPTEEDRLLVKAFIDCFGRKM